MDKSTHRQDLDRANAESAAHIRASHTSLESTAQHIEQSREAIARSLQLLGDTARQVK